MISAIEYFDVGRMRDVNARDICDRREFVGVSWRGFMFGAWIGHGDHLMIYR